MLLRQKISIQNLRKFVAKLSIIGIIFTPWGADGSCARDFFLDGGGGLVTSVEPRKARFLAEQKMRPNKVVKKPPIIC
jgi:hypothetical protein